MDSHPIREKKKRRTKLTRNEINFIVLWAKDKPIFEKKVSAKNIQIKFNKLSKILKEKGLNKKISLSTANRILNKHISKPRIIRKIFSLKPYERHLRLDFYKYMKENNIDQYIPNWENTRNFKKLLSLDGLRVSHIYPRFN